MLYCKGVQFKLSIICLIMILNSCLLFSAIEWPRIERATQNTVVQVWTQGSKKSWLHPYNPPSQHQGVGTAFFINDKGDIC